MCDFAEVYHIFDYKALPLRTAAALFVGLGPNSRIKRKISGQTVDDTTALLAIIADRLGLLVWGQTKDGQCGRNRPKSIFDAIMGGETINPQVRGYSSAEDFEAARKKIIGKEG